MTLFDLTEDSGAELSPCRRYRYRLWRRWSDGPVVNFVMLNPSTADAEQDDPTVRRCVGFAKSWGAGGLVVTNLYALRSTDPKALWTADDPVGPENAFHLGSGALGADTVVCAWGAEGARNGRGNEVLRPPNSTSF
jgi:hypothetical protein